MPPEESAVIDAPVEESVDTSLVDQPTDTATPETSTDVEGDSGLDTAAGADKGPSLWRSIDAKLKSGEKLSTRDIAAMRRAIHFEHNHSQKYPNGIQELEATKAALQPLIEDETMPVGDAVQQIAQERSYYRELDQAFSQAKPEFVAKLVEADKDAFMQLAPQVFQQFSELNNEGFSAYVTGSVLSYMNGQQVPLQYEILRTFLPQLPDGPIKDQVVNAVNTLWKTQRSLESLASKPVNKPFQAKAAETPENTGDAATLKMENNALKWDREADPKAMSLIAREAPKYAGKTSLSEKEMGAVRAKVSEELDARLSANKQYRDAMRGYLQNGNRTAYVQRLDSERAKIIPGAVRRAVDDVVAARPKAQRPVDGTVKPSGAPKPGSPVNASDPNQYRRISAYPKGQIDLTRTKQAMILANTAYLKGEAKPVTWGKR